MTGAGNGMVVQRGYPTPPSFHIDRLRTIEAGYFFDVMTNGFGRMPDYRAQMTPRDRWNIVAYIRALQLAEHAHRQPPSRAAPDIEQQEAGRSPGQTGRAPVTTWLHS